MRAPQVTGESVWEKPEYKHHDADTGRDYYVDPDTGESVWQKPEKYAWMESTDDEGKSYYYNEVSGASQWEVRPGRPPPSTRGPDRAPPSRGLHLRPPPAAAAPHRRGADAPIPRQVPEMYAWKEHEEEDEL